MQYTDFGWRRLQGQTHHLEDDPPPPESDPHRAWCSAPGPSRGSWAWALLSGRSAQWSQGRAGRRPVGEHRADSTGHQSHRVSVVNIW